MATTEKRDARFSYPKNTIHKLESFKIYVMVPVAEKQGGTEEYKPVMRFITRLEWNPKMWYAEEGKPALEFGSLDRALDMVSALGFNMTTAQVVINPEWNNEFFRTNIKKKGEKENERKQEKADR